MRYQLRARTGCIYAARHDTGASQRSDGASQRSGAASQRSDGPVTSDSNSALPLEYEEVSALQAQLQDQANYEQHRAEHPELHAVPAMMSRLQRDIAEVLATGNIDMHDTLCMWHGTAEEASELIAMKMLESVSGKPAGLRHAYSLAAAKGEHAAAYRAVRQELSELVDRVLTALLFGHDIRGDFRASEIFRRFRRLLQAAQPDTVVYISTLVLNRQAKHQVEQAMAGASIGLHAAGSQCNLHAPAGNRMGRLTSRLEDAAKKKHRKSKRATEQSDGSSQSEGSRGSVEGVVHPFAQYEAFCNKFAAEEAFVALSQPVGVGANYVRVKVLTVRRGTDGQLSGVLGTYMGSAFGGFSVFYEQMATAETVAAVEAEEAAEKAHESEDEAGAAADGEQHKQHEAHAPSDDGAAASCGALDSAAGASAEGLCAAPPDAVGVAAASLKQTAADGHATESQLDEALAAVRHEIQGLTVADAMTLPNPEADMRDNSLARRPDVLEKGKRRRPPPAPHASAHAPPLFAACKKAQDQDVS
ncbi:hypothetical protein COCSUDRAFT_61202 [Coccomyxa subellipsoidea C-169]|uniref:Uncharacterized protein n=1 Tax=Coccomyxa subellipsoidea (strain C-169) TaxID=574566 RepID=I0Z6F0_COCSC|nr:hypothetical protein COCSUDRAFT_61202 [Coccomyxa subellipsoidea C-169]EIE26219.1 hypothetical protein COCSUDRAFT_61202 [Coccomyxa subellipsoidea C-169]|eukprot:XP_005650763.1 hypothetical protein COCSUDRAFT_61202 [Coccomyxa subellipsoidea C-169]